MNYERLFLDHLPVIDQVVRFVSRRHHFTADEAEELRSGVYLKVVDHDYEILRNFEGRSTLRTYLTTVVECFFLDARAARWGKWRPSVLARRLGPVAVLLDQFLTRDGLTVDEAIQKLITNHGVTLSSEELTGIAGALPTRTPRRFVGEEDLADLAVSPRTEEGILSSIDRGRQTDRVTEALRDALAQLNPEDRLIVKLRFQDNLQISQIARMFGVEQKPLYGRQARLLAVLKRELAARGVSAPEIEALIGDPVTPLADVIVESTGIGNPSQSPSER